MSRAQGKPLVPEEKSLIVTLKKYFDRNKESFGLNETSVQLVSEALLVGKATVSRIIAAYNKDPKSIENIPCPKGRPNRIISNSFQEKIPALPVDDSNLLNYSK